MVIGTTRTDLATQVELGILPAELVRALAGVRIELPPLRERKEDIRALMRAVVAREKLAIDFGREEEAHAIERLLLHPWRRNAWELEEVMREVALVAPGPLTIAGMQQVIGSVAVARTARVVTDAEVLEAYADCGEHERRAARALEMSVERFRMRMRRLGTLAAHD